MNTLTARDIAEQITESYTDASQFEAVAFKGCDEWEEDTAAELTAGLDIDVGDVLAAIAEICINHVAVIHRDEDGGIVERYLVVDDTTHISVSPTGLRTEYRRVSHGWVPAELH